MLEKIKLPTIVPVPNKSGFRSHFDYSGEWKFICDFLGNRPFDDKDPETVKICMFVEVGIFHYQGNNYPSTSHLVNEKLREMFWDKNFGLENTLYVQEVFQDLQDDEIRKNLQNVVEQLGKTGIDSKEGQLSKLYDNFVGAPNLSDLDEMLHPDAAWQNHLYNFLQGYLDFVQIFPQFEAAQSSALRSIDSFFEKVQGSDEFKELKGWLEAGNKAYHPFELRFREILDLDKYKKLDKTLALDAFKCFIREISKIRSFFDLEMTYSEIIKKQNKFIPQAEETVNRDDPLYSQLSFYDAYEQYFARLRKEEGVPITMPKILPNQERRMKIVGARDPLSPEMDISFDVTYKPDSDTYDISTSGNHDGLWYKKRIVCFQLMAQAGLYLPAESAEISFRGWIGDICKDVKKSKLEFIQ